MFLPGSCSSFLVLARIESTGNEVGSARLLSPDAIEKLSDDVRVDGVSDIFSRL